MKQVRWCHQSSVIVVLSSASPFSLCEVNKAEDCGLSGNFKMRALRKVPFTLSIHHTSLCASCYYRNQQVNINLWFGLLSELLTNQNRVFNSNAVYHAGGGQYCVILKTSYRCIYNTLRLQAPCRRCSNHCPPFTMSFWRRIIFFDLIMHASVFFNSFPNALFKVNSSEASRLVWSSSHVTVLQKPPRLH